MRPSTQQAIARSTFSTGQIVDVLDSAVGILMDKGWCQKRRMTSQGSMCLLGAISYAINPDTVSGWGLPRAFPTQEESRLATICSIVLCDTAGLERLEQLVTWNDHRGRQRPEVVELLWNSIKRIEDDSGRGEEEADES